MKIKSRFLFLAIACSSFWGCVKEGPAGKNALIEQIAEPPGEYCSAGGFKIMTGIDDNRNNELDSNEILKTEYVCNGPAGKNTLIDQIAEPPGENCTAGGFKILTGIDDNRNNVLDSNEILKTEYVCNGTYNKETVIFTTPDGIGHWTETAAGSVRVGIDNFNITNYQVDSISFSAYLVTADANVNCFVELYDLTNNKVINNTLLSGNSTTNQLKATTLNFINELPKSGINLGFRIRSEKEGSSVVVSRLTIKLYKK